MELGRSAAAVINAEVEAFGRGHNTPDNESASGFSSFIPPFIQDVFSSPDSNKREVVTENQNAGGEARIALQNYLASTTDLNPEIVLDIYRDHLASSERGQAMIDSQDAEAAAEARAKTILEAGQGTVDGVSAYLEAIDNESGASSREILANRAAYLNATKDDGPLSDSILSIGLSGAPQGDIGTASAIVNNILESQRRDKNQTALIGAESYTDNPVEKLRTHVTENLGITDINQNLTSAVNKLAESEGITQAEAAYSLARAAEIDGFLPDLSIGGDNLSQWRATTFARDNFKDDRSEVARRDAAAYREVINEVQATISELGRINMKIQKLRRNNQDVSKNLLARRDAYTEELQILYRQYRNQGNSTSNGTPLQIGINPP